MTNTLFIKQGNKFLVTNDAALDMHPTLPAQPFLVCFDPEKGYYLEEVRDFEVPAKFYGNTLALRDRFLRTFQDRPGNTGVLLSGEKGSGKSALLRAIAIGAAAVGMPTLIVASEFAGAPFNKFLSSITQEVVVTYDEFEKVFDEEAQNNTLTLLDGVFTSKKLFVFTVNDLYRVNSHIQNRPGRAFYHIRYRGLEEAVIREYCADNLTDQAQIDGVLEVAATIDAFSFDMLKALVEEMNRYSETAKQSAQLLNMRPESSKSVRWDLKASRDAVGRKKAEAERHNNWEGKNPLHVVKHLYVDMPSGVDFSEPLHQESLVSQTRDQMVFKQNGFTFIFTRTVSYDYSYS